MKGHLIDLRDRKFVSVSDSTLLHEFKMMVILIKCNEYSAYQVTFIHSTQQQSYDRCLYNVNVGLQEEQPF